MPWKISSHVHIWKKSNVFIACSTFSYDYRAAFFCSSEVETWEEAGWSEGEKKRLKVGKSSKLSVRARKITSLLWGDKSGVRVSLRGKDISALSTRQTILTLAMAAAAKRSENMTYRLVPRFTLYSENDTSLSVRLLARVWRFLQSIEKMFSALRGCVWLWKCEIFWSWILDEMENFSPGGKSCQGAHLKLLKKSWINLDKNIFYNFLLLFFHPSQITVTGSTRGSMESIKSQGEREKLSDFHFGSIWRGEVVLRFSHMWMLFSPLLLYFPTNDSLPVCAHRKKLIIASILCVIFMIAEIVGELLA